MKIPRWMFKLYLIITNDDRIDSIWAAESEIRRRKEDAYCTRYSSITKSVSNMSDEELRRLMGDS